MCLIDSSLDQPAAGSIPRSSMPAYEGRKVIKMGRAREVGDGEDQREVDGRLFVCQKQP